jgi:membrane fusion protein, heavy metal efflux system
MSTRDQRNTRLMMTAAAVIVAGGVGFGIAKLTTRPRAAPEAAEAAKPAGPATIEVPAAHLAAVGIALETVRSGSLGGEILAPATVTSAPNGEAVVTAHAAGTVVRLTKRLGDPVRAGEALALIESRDAATAAADRTTAQAKLDLARRVAARERRLYEQRVSARQDMEMAQAELAAAQAEARRASATAAAVHVGRDGRSAAVVSPIAGRITAQTAALGAYVEPSAELFRVADPRFVQVQAQVSAADAARLAPGDAAVLVRADGSTIDAVVRSVTPTVSGESRTATVLLSPGSSAGLTPGLGLQARLLPRAGAGAGSSVVVPDEAVQSIDGRDVVFVRTAKGFLAQPVVVASRSGGRASIASGLTAGQSIATRNAFLLKAELQKGGDE